LLLVVFSSVGAALGTRPRRSAAALGGTGLLGPDLTGQQIDRTLFFATMIAIGLPTTP
jgi:hypothetical protein